MADADGLQLPKPIFGSDLGGLHGEGDSAEGLFSPRAVKRPRIGGSGDQPRAEVPPAPKEKLQELFFTWLCDAGSRKTIHGLISDYLGGLELTRAERRIVPPGADQSKYLSAPKSPVSRLIRTSATFPPSPGPQPKSPQNRLAHRLLISQQGAPHSILSDVEGEHGDNAQMNARRSSSLSRKTSFGSISTDSKTERPVIGRFYFPMGRVNPPEQDTQELADVLVAFNAKARQNSMRGVSKPELSQLIVEEIGLPSFMTTCIYNRMTQNHSSGNGGRTELERASSSTVDHDSIIKEDAFMLFYREYCVGKSPPARLFSFLLNRSTKNYLSRENLRAILDGVVEYHPGLMFLRKTPEFQSRYTETVIERVFYSCAKRNTRCLFLGDIVRSRFLDCLLWLDQEEDINTERKFFSYKHFYVLYCRFWELDKDHDLYISLEDLLRYGNGSLTVRIAKRVFNGCGKESDSALKNHLSYTDFVWFCLSEEDKKSSRALDYWFRCVDLDGDGIITLENMEYFYGEQYSRMEDRGNDPIEFRDIACQLLDMLKLPASTRPFIKKEVLRSSQLQNVFFNFLFNLDKFFQIESRDPRLLHQERALPDYTDWDRFAAAEYERLTSADDEMMVLNADTSVPDMDM